MRTVIYVMLAISASLLMAYPVYAQKIFEQGITIAQSDGRYIITCFSEPSHPSGVNGDVTVFADMPYSRTVRFSVGDVNSNGIEDDHVMLTFPDDFGARPATDFTVLCNLWSGSDRDEEGAYSSITAEFWQSIYTDGSMRLRQGLIMPETINVHGSAEVACFSEPAGTGTVDGVVVVITPDGRAYFTHAPFSRGDVDGNGVDDDHLLMRFPDDFPMADTGSAGEYTVFCDLTNGARGEDGVTLRAGEFWQFFWVSFNVIPESIIGMVLLLLGPSIALLLYRWMV
ncbi:MAG: hypothetical protein RMI32_05025 [Candidatus Nitrosocaldus sp.]|nr:hypothetical protein [Candidatus Nitrosocaldus sp.]